MLWWCETWKSAKAPILANVMLLAKTIKLGALSEWPPCIRLCGVIPKGMVKHSGMAKGARWKKRCRELNKVPRH